MSNSSTPTQSALTIDFLRENTEKIHHFGLGFIQLKMKDPKVRYHFYDKDITRIVKEEEIHNHRYIFESEILAGELDQIIYNVPYVDHKEATHTYGPVSCDPKFPVPKSADKRAWCTVIPAVVMKLVQGSKYRITPAIFHNVYSDFAITKLRLGEELYKYAIVVRKTGEAVVCPFSQPGNPDDLWAKVEEMLKRAYPPQSEMLLCTGPK